MISKETSTVLLGCAIVVLVIVRVLKSDKIPINIPDRWKPVFASVLTMAAGIATAVLQGIPLQDAAVAILTSAVAPMGMHELLTKIAEIVSGKSGGK